MFFESTYKYYIHDKSTVVISKVHYNSFIFFNMILSTIVYYNMDNQNMDKINVKYDFTFRVHL